MVFLESGEVMLLFIAALGYIPVVWTYRHNPETKLFTWGYSLLLLGLVSAILGTFLWPTIFEILEHGMGILLPAILFFLYAQRNYHKSVFLRKKMEELDDGS
ncbi:MAG: hypothetical protein Q8P05_01745 [Candidatus Diapherotrites archaeon]|nr:hypothetical protein [Candidatus Diapherotrites archaeon]MDZ4256346.1 hypothetical protein [archaeon]